MPRPNPTRHLFAEANVAARVALERERRGMSYEGLAKRLSDIGCPIQASAIFKIEKGTPRRRITVDELVGFAAAFGMSVEELLVDPEVRLGRELTRSLQRLALLKQRLAEHRNQSKALHVELEREAAEVRRLIEQEPALQEAVDRLGLNEGPDGLNSVLTEMETLS